MKQLSIDRKILLKRELQNMVNHRPDFCPYCGTQLTTKDFDGRQLLFCDDCDQIIWHNPVPTAGVTVVDGNSLLLVERGFGIDAGDWMVPGGHIEIGEHPHTAAARELEEETGIVVDPSELELLVARQSIYPDSGEKDKHIVSIDYVVTRSSTSGSLEAGSDADDAHFWTPHEFEESDEDLREVHADRFGSDSLEWLVEEAKSVIH